MNAISIMMPAIVIIVIGSNTVSWKVGKSLRNVWVATEFAILPTIIETTIPKTDPQNPSIIASALKQRKTLLLLIPRALSRPISRVRSWTDMNNVLMMPIAAATRAIAPKILNTTRIASKKTRIMPTSSSIVMAVRPIFSSSSLICEIFSGSTSATAWKVRLVPSGIPLALMLLILFQSARFARLPPLDSMPGAWVPVTFASTIVWQSLRFVAV